MLIDDTGFCAPGLKCGKNLIDQCLIPTQCHTNKRHLPCP